VACSGVINITEVGLVEEVLEFLIHQIAPSFDIPFS